MRSYLHSIALWCGGVHRRWAVAFPAAGLACAFGCHDADRIDVASGGSGHGSSTAIIAVSSVGTTSSGQAFCPSHVYHPAIWTEVEPSAMPSSCTPMPPEFHLAVDTDGTVHHHDGVLHVRPFAADPDHCLAEDYGWKVLVPPELMASDPFIPDGAFVHLTYEQTNGSFTLVIRNLPSFDDEPNPVATHASTWLFLGERGDAVTVAYPFDDFTFTTPFECTDSNNTELNATFALDVQAKDDAASVHVPSNTFVHLDVAMGPNAGSYAVLNAGIGTSGQSHWHDVGIYRLAP